MQNEKAQNRLKVISKHLTINKTKTSKAKTSVFGNIPVAPADAILGLNMKYKADTYEKKVNLGVGAYRTDEGKPYILKCVRMAEKKLERNLANKEYLPQQGEPSFREVAPKILLGKEYSNLVEEGKVATIQSLSGTGALRLGFEFISQFLPKNTLVYLPNPTWGNHKRVVQHAGIDKSRLRSYQYYSKEKNGLDLDGFLKDLKSAPSKSLFLLHLCAHNPTGVDPNKEEWKKIGKVCKDKNHLVFFDNAYQGFASGSLLNDSYPIRLFLSLGMELLCAQSFAKNLGLYGERIGACRMICNNSETAKAIVTQMKVIVRGMYSNPPLHGARLVATILGDKELYNVWMDDLALMSSRIKLMRQRLFDELKKLKTPGTWTHILNQIGMFTFTGLDKKQVDLMINKHHIYMLSNGRISMAGLNSGNVTYVAKAINDVVCNK